jgi:hypothetical protein
MCADADAHVKSHYTVAHVALRPRVPQVFYYATDNRAVAKTAHANDTAPVPRGTLQESPVDAMDIVGNRHFNTPGLNDGRGRTKAIHLRCHFPPNRLVLSKLHVSSPLRDGARHHVDSPLTACLSGLPVAPALLIGPSVPPQQAERKAPDTLVLNRPLCLTVSLLAKGDVR